MNETMLVINGASYVRVVEKAIQAHPGMGITRLMFSLEITNRDQNSQGYPMWLSGRVEVEVRGGNRPYIGRLQPSTAQPVNIGRFGHDASVQLTLDLTDQQFWQVDENRTGGAVRMYLTFSGHVILDNQHVAIQESQPMTVDISQSEWLELIRMAGLKQKILLELDAPRPQEHPELADALNYYSQAQSRFSEGEWRQAVESVRQSLASLVGKKADDEDQADDVTAALRDARRAQSRVQYEARRELVRQAAKFMADLGAHPETAETRKPDAYAALLIAGGLLHAFTTAT
jgi:hypothetical protein